MRIMCITNYYAPCKYAGGYAQLCEEVAGGLFARGHTVAVLTSTYRDGNQNTRLYPVYRILHIDPDLNCGRLYAWQFFVDRRRRERQAVADLRRLVEELCPDVIFVWHAAGLPRALLQQAERMPNVVVAYYLADYFPEVPDEYIVYWQLPPVHWTAKLFKCLLAKLASHMLAREGKPIRLSYENVICVSEHVKRRLVSKELISANAVVIHNGVDLSHFSFGRYSSCRSLSGSLRCLIAGRVEPDKGIHTVIEALALLRTRAELDRTTLTILGDGPADYGEYLQDRVSGHRLQGVVEFRSPVPRARMPEILAGYDALILPSEYDEPLARAIQEAMAMGLLVIGTTTGGSGELLVHERTGLVFEPGNPESLAVQLVRAVNEPQLVAQLAENGRQEVKQNFDIQRTVEQIERYLLDLVKVPWKSRVPAKKSLC
jgi:glycosyltransferase involved in cell wall biosynthesis